MTFVALPVQCYALTHSTFAVGMLGVAEFVPILLLALVGGALADAFDRRRLIALAEEPARWSSRSGSSANALLDQPGGLGAVRRRGAVGGVRRAAAAAAGRARAAPGRARRAQGGVRGQVALWNLGVRWAARRWAGLLIVTAAYAATYAVDAREASSSRSGRSPRSARRRRPPTPRPPSLRVGRRGRALRGLAARS